MRRLGGVIEITENKSDLICRISNEDQIYLDSNEWMEGIRFQPGFSPRSTGIATKWPMAFIAHLLLFSLLAVHSGAQQAYVVSGIVHDATGGLIPGASVVVDQPGIGAPTTSQTDEQGAFRVALPTAGSYQVEIQAAGFVAYRVAVAVGSTTPIADLDATLAVSGDTQTVEVTADALAAETTSTQLGSRSTRRRSKRCR